MAVKQDNKQDHKTDERSGAIRCQCTRASESQITAVFRKFAADHPSRDISYDDVHAGINDTGRQNADDQNLYGSGERQCFGCDPLLHMLVKKFNESHDPDTLFARKRQGGRKGHLARAEAQNSGLCDFARNHDYRGMNGRPPDLKSDPVNGGKPKDRTSVKP